MPARKPPASSGHDPASDRPASGEGRAEGEASSPAPRADGSAGEPRITRIARRAHQIYLARGGAEGKAVDDWLQAEREIDAEIERDDRAGGDGTDPARRSG